MARRVRITSNSSPILEAVLVMAKVYHSSAEIIRTSLMVLMLFDVRLVLALTLS